MPAGFRLATRGTRRRATLPVRSTNLTEGGLRAEKV